jgi:hypothetical protein
MQGRVMVPFLTLPCGPWTLDRDYVKVRSQLQQVFGLVIAKPVDQMV